MTFGFRLLDLALAIVADAWDRTTGRRKAEEAVREARVARAMAEEALRLACEERENGWNGK